LIELEDALLSRLISRDKLIAIKNILDKLRLAGLRE